MIQRLDLDEEQLQVVGVCDAGLEPPPTAPSRGLPHTTGSTGGADFSVPLDRTSACPEHESFTCTCTNQHFLRTTEVSCALSTRNIIWRTCKGGGVFWNHVRKLPSSGKSPHPGFFHELMSCRNHYL